MRLSRPRVLWILAALLIVVVLAWAFGSNAVPADFATIEKGTLRVTLEEEGETRVRDRYFVSAPMPGRMLRVELEPGDPVKAGETVLVRLVPPDPALLDARTRAELSATLQAAQASVGAARAERDRIRADLKYARTELQRYRDLAREGIASKERLDAAERQVRTLEEALRSAEFTIRTTEHQVEVARAGLSQASGSSKSATIDVRSPVDGVVLRRLQESETVVQAGQPLLEIGNVSHLEIVSDFLSNDAVRIEPGDAVLVERWGGEQPLSGRVRLVEPYGFMKVSALGVEEQRVNVIIDFDDPKQASELGDGYRVEVNVIVWEQENVVKAPTSALFRHGDGWAVFRVEGSRARRTPVTIGQRSALQAEIRSGLSPGDRVIVFPSGDVEDGAAVQER
jgi:HlyD family secretion protein